MFGVRTCDEISWDNYELNSSFGRLESYVPTFYTMSTNSAFNPYHKQPPQTTNFSDHLWWWPTLATTPDDQLRRPPPTAKLRWPPPIVNFDNIQPPRLTGNSNNFRMIFTSSTLMTIILNYDYYKFVHYFNTFDKTKIK